MVVVLRLDDGNRNIRLIIEDVVCAFLLSTRMKLSLHIDPAGSKRFFLSNLKVNVPARLRKGRSDKFCANVPFCQGLSVEH